MSKQNSKKWRFVLYIIGALTLLGVKFGFDSSIETGVIALIAALVLLAIPTISIIREKFHHEERCASSPSIFSSSPASVPAPKSSSQPCSVPSSLTEEHPRQSIPRYDYFSYTHLSSLPPSYVCVDLETTGLYPERDRITEVAAARVENGVITDSFSSLVHSPVAIDSYVSKLTGITNEMIADAPGEAEIIRKLFTFIDNSPIVGYNVSFDVSFLHYAAYRASVPLVHESFDVQSYAKKGLPGRPGYKLSNVAEYLSVEQPDAHRALADVLTTVACAEKLRPIVEEIEEKKRKEAARQKAIAEFDFSRIDVDYKAIVPFGEIDSEAPFCGKRVVFTGALERMTRQEACQIVANLGGQPWGTVTKGTAYLVVGNGPASPYDDPDTAPKKVLKADEWRAKGSKIQTISEKEFFEMIDNYERRKTDD